MKCLQMMILTNRIMQCMLFMKDTLSSINCPSWIIYESVVDC